MAVATNPTHLPSKPAHVGWFGTLVGAKSRFQIRRAVWGYIFALPWILGLIIFWGGPILASLYFSFTNYEVIGAPKWLGLENYIQAFTKDDLFWASLGRTFFFTGVFVPTTIFGALILAIILNQKLVGTNVYRSIFFIPHLVPAVALAVVWIYLLQPRLGPVNQVLRNLGIENPPAWLASRDSALYSVTLINVWAAMGGHTMLIFLAGLTEIPPHLCNGCR